MDRLPPDILAKIQQGRAVLLAGPDLNPGEAARVPDSGRAVSDVLRAPTVSELDRLASLRDEVASDRHVEVARQPWSLVLTTALDARLTSALEAAAPLARRVRRKFANDLDATDLSRSAVAPSVMHLLLERDPAGVDGRLPSAGSFVRLSRILLPAILASLTPAIGADQVVVISGISPLDVLNADDLAAALEPLDPSQIVICAPGGDIQWPSDLIPGASVLRADLASLLSAARLDGGNITSPLLEADDLALSARDPSSGSRRQIVFRAAELQEIRRFVTLLPDGFPRPRAEPQDTESAFERFVRTPRLKADYESFRSEFCVVREAYTQLRRKVEARLERSIGQTQSRGRSDGPLFLTGYPGSGRTTGLHWLGAELRSAGWCVAHLTSDLSEPDPLAIEQVLRLIENRLREAGALDVVVLLADGLARDVPGQIDSRLRQAGRRAVVVASAIPRAPYGDAEDAPQRGEEIRLDYALSPGEFEQLSTVLNSVGRPLATRELKELGQIEGFLGVLDRAVPGAHMSLREILRDDLQRALPLIGLAMRRVQNGLKRGTLGEQLAKAFAARGLPQPTQDAVSLESGAAEAREFIACVFMLAGLDRGAPLDLLVRRFPTLLRNYEDVRRVGEASGFLRETTLGDDAEPVLVPVNPALGRILQTEAGGPIDRVHELARLARHCVWPSGDVPIVDLSPQTRFVLECLRAVSPRGSFESAYRASETLRELRNVFRELRENHGFRLPQALHLEAMILRTSVSQDPSATRQAELRACLDLLDEASSALELRRQSPSRDHLLGSVLVTRATVLRDLMRLDIESGGPAAAEHYAAAALEAVKRSQSLQDNWHPFDVACIVYRDMADAWNASGNLERPKLLDALSKMAMLLDIGPESSELDSRQRAFRADRERDYTVRTQGVDVALSEAKAEAERGDVRGLCYILRQGTFSGDGRLTSVQAAEDAFWSLFRYSEAALGDESARAFLLRLWAGVALRGKALDDWPHVVALEAKWWDAIERIAAPDASAGFDTRRPIAIFWLATSLLRRGASSEAKPFLRDLSSLSFVARVRAMEPLIILADGEGSARRFRALVRRNEPGRQIVAFVPDLDIELQVQQRHRGVEFLNARPRDIVDLHVATNLRGVLGVGPAWLSQRRAHDRGAA